MKIIKLSVIISMIIAILDATFSDFDYEKLFSVETLAMYFFYSFVLTTINIVFFDLFNKKVGWKDANITKAVLASAGSIFLTLVGYFLCRLVDLSVFQDIPVATFLQNESLKFYFFPLLFTTIITLIFHLIFFYRAVQEKRVKEQKIIAGTASAKFDALKNQLDPHFLFNSLNVLASLIDENPYQAQRFTTSLSKVYRYVLEQKDKDLVPLAEELRFAALYMKLLEMRFEDSIFFEMPKNLSLEEAKVVPLSLQLLLENTVKHNIVSDKQPLHIKITEEAGYLVVSNNLQKKEVLGNRKGVGLQNIVNRYNLITRRRVLIEQNELFFKVKLPILTKQMSIMESYVKHEENAYFKAKQRVKEMKEFYGNLLSYCIVIPFLAFVNYSTFWSFQWFWFPLFGWGIGLTVHGFSVFGYGSNWEERKIRELMEKDQQQNKSWN